MSGKPTDNALGDMERSAPEAPKPDQKAHDVWFRAQVQAALDDPRPSVPHDEVMAQIQATIEAAKRKQKAAT